MTVSVKTQKYGQWMEITKNGVRKRESKKESGQCHCSCHPCNFGIYLAVTDYLGNLNQFPWRERFLCNIFLPENIHIEQLQKVIYGYQYPEFPADVL